MNQCIWAYGLVKIIGSFRDRDEVKQLKCISRAGLVQLNY